MLQGAMASLSVIDVLSAGWKLKDGAEPAGNTGKARHGFNPSLLHHIHTANQATWWSVRFSESPTSLSVCPAHHPFMVPFMSVGGGVCVLSLHQHLGLRKWKQVTRPPAVLLIRLFGSQVAFQPVYEPLCPVAPYFHTLLLILTSEAVMQTPKWLKWPLKS